jgi:hypothetical protein
VKAAARLVQASFPRSSPDPLDQNRSCKGRPSGRPFAWNGLSEVISATKGELTTPPFRPTL